jgi:ATP-binding cassette subfamily C protein
MRRPSRRLRGDRGPEPGVAGWGTFFRTGNAAIKFRQIEWYVTRRLKRLLRSFRADATTGVSPSSSSGRRTGSPASVFDTVRKGYILVGTGRRGRWALLILMGLGISFIELVGAALVYLLLAMVSGTSSTVSIPIIGNISVGHGGHLATSAVVLTSACIAGFFIVRGLAYLAQSYAQNRIAQNAGVAISDRLLDGYLRMPYAFHINQNSSDLIRNVQGISSELASYVFVPTIQLASQSIFLITMIGLIAAVEPLATVLVAVTVGPFVLIVLRIVQPRLAAMGQSSQVLWSDNLRSLRQSLEGIKDVRISGSETFFRHQYLSSRASLARLTYMRGVLTDLPRVVIETVLMIGVLTFLSVVVVLAGSNRQQVLPIVGFFTYASLRMLPSISALVASLNMVKFGGAGVEMLFVDLQRVSRLMDNRPAGPPIAFDDRIHIDDVCFRYQPDRPLVLEDICLTIPKGAFVGVAGTTGSGKSTLIDIILGLLEPESGTVCVDGADVRRNLRSWHRMIGLVPQQVFLLDDTLRRNVALGLEDDEIDDDRLWHALEMAQIADDVRRLPEGLDASMGERGIRFSGGQRQRLGIARALYRDSELLIFDEATSALDARTEENVMTALRRDRPSTTMIHITHRVASLRHADKVVVMERGRIVAQGPYADLVADSRAFQRIMTPVQAG